MKISRLFAGILLFFVDVAFSQVPPPPKEGAKSDKVPQIVVPQRNIALGKVLEGDVVPVVWTIYNKGTADLILSETRASCGCTVVKLTDEQKTIPAGGKLDLTAQFDSHRRFGDQKKAVAVESNDPTEPKLQLEFSAEVEKTYELSPTELNLRSVRRGVLTEKAITITPEGGRKVVEVVDITYRNPEPLLYKAEPIVAKGGTGQKITFTVTEDAALGSLLATANIKIKIDGLERNAELRIRGEIVADLTWTPKVLDATRQTSPPGQKLAPITVKSTEARAFEITDAKVGPMLDVKFERSNKESPNSDYEVLLTVREDAPPGPFGTTLRLFTTLLDQPIVEIPVYGNVAEKIEIEPTVVLLRQDGTPLGEKRRLKLMVAPQIALNLSEARCDLSAVAVAVDPESITKHRHLRFVNVSLNGKMPPGRHEGSIILRTDLVGMEEVKVPVIVEVPK